MKTIFAWIKALFHPRCSQCHVVISVKNHTRKGKLLCANCTSKAFARKFGL